MLTRRSLPVAIAAAVALIAGVVVLVHARSRVDGNWIAYAPLSNATYRPPAQTVFHATGACAGVALIAIGAVLVGTLIGSRVGSRG